MPACRELAFPIAITSTDRRSFSQNDQFRQFSGRKSTMPCIDDPRSTLPFMRLGRRNQQHRTDAGSFAQRSFCGAADQSTIDQSLAVDVHDKKIV